MPAYAPMLSPTIMLKICQHNSPRPTSQYWNPPPPPPPPSSYVPCVQKLLRFQNIACMILCSLPVSFSAAAWSGYRYVTWEWDRNVEPLICRHCCFSFIGPCWCSVALVINEFPCAYTTYRSCAYRDVIGHHLSCDPTWLSTNPINPLSIGQFVNNHTRG